MSDGDDLQRALIRRIAGNRWIAHQYLFAHRHPDASPPAHEDLIQNIYSPNPRKVIEGFRGFAKSTYLEEAAVLLACERRFHNLVIVGSSYSRACDRLAAVKRELDMNERLVALYGRQHGTTWQEGRIVLAGDGPCIQALGRDQSMLGMKYLDWRPDAALIDDVEDPDEVRTDAERAQTWGWFLKTFLPSLSDPVGTWVRVLGTRRGKGSLPERLEADHWPVVKYPIEFPDAETGERRPMWPAKFPLAKIDEMKATYRGDMDTWAQEYMCEATSEAARVFTRDMLVCEPRARTWRSVYAMYDPARTTGRGAATTGKAVWSWEGRRLVFWAVDAQQWMPDQIIDDIFATQREYDCTWVGFEEDGLNEWAKQPIRAEAVKRRLTLPLLPVRAPRGKNAFIASLQPYLKAGEVVFAGDPALFEEAFGQFLSFPYGRIDAPNAAAYALLLRPGSPVYEDFSDEHVDPNVEPIEGRPLYLAANSDGRITTAVLCQRSGGELLVLADWVREGMPSEVVGEIASEAQLQAETGEWREQSEPDPDQPYKLPVRRTGYNLIPPRWIVGPKHRDLYMNVGLMQAIRSIPMTVSSTEATSESGRTVLASMLRARTRGLPVVRVSPQARWTLRGLAGGYARGLDRRGLPAIEPDAGVYQLVIEGLESFAAVGAQLAERHEDQQPMALDRRGVPYRSAMPMRG